MRDKKMTVWLIALLLILFCTAGASAQTPEELLRQATEEKAGDEKEESEQQTGTRMRTGLELPWLEKAVDPDEYRLGPYDRLLVNIVGPEPRSFPLVVLPEGFVFLPGIGGIYADGLTITEFRKNLSSEMEKYFKNVDIFCYLQQPRVFRVFVTGEVPKPGAVEVSAVQRVSDAIELAGSIKSKGSNRRVLLSRGEEKIEVDILKFVLQGDFSGNPFLSNGDRIHVPVASKHAVIRGSVNRSAVFELLPDETIADLLELAGGFSSEALKDNVLLSRIGEDGSVLTTPIEESAFSGTVLRDRDEINVMDGMTGTSRVYVFGATMTTGHYFITEGEGLTELLGRIGSFDPDVNLRAASIERKSGEIIRLDLRDYLPPSPKKSMKLRDGDMLHIPTISKMVAVGGEVQEPGKFNYEGDWTIAQYIGLAGGPTEKGSVDRVVIYSVDGKSRKGDRHTRPNRGDVIIVKRSKSNLIGSFFSSLISLGLVTASIIALTNN